MSIIHTIVSVMLPRNSTVERQFQTARVFRINSGIGGVTVWYWWEEQRPLCFCFLAMQRPHVDGSVGDLAPQAPNTLT